MKTKNSTKKLVSLTLKDEHNGTGPLYKNYGDGSYDNYKDSDMKHSWDDNYFAEWYTPTQAEKIAKRLKVPLEYI